MCSENCTWMEYLPKYPAFMFLYPSKPEGCVHSGVRNISVRLCLFGISYGHRMFVTCAENRWEAQGRERRWHKQSTTEIKSTTVHSELEMSGCRQGFRWDITPTCTFLGDVLRRLSGIGIYSHSEIVHCSSLCYFSFNGW